VNLKPVQFGCCKKRLKTKKVSLNSLSLIVNPWRGTLI
jgi:hypothetical protein